MTRYYFFVRGGAVELPDKIGTLLPSDSVALSLAKRVVRQVIEGDEYDYSGLSLLVTNDAGKTVFEIPFLDAGPARERLLH